MCMTCSHLVLVNNKGELSRQLQDAADERGQGREKVGKACAAKLASVYRC